MSENPARKFYDRISHVYDLIADGGEHAAREQGLERLAVSAGESVLEIGFGTGHALVTLAEQTTADGGVTGIDISEGMKEVAGKRLAKAGLENRVEMLVQDAPPIPLDDDRFDVVFMSFTLELFDREVIPELLAECRRVLRPGGRLGIVSMASVEEGQKESAMEKSYIWMHQHFPHIVDCQPIPAETLLRESGFTLTSQERISLFGMPVAVLVAE